METFTLVSVIVAAYNSEKTIGRCIESLLALDYYKYEIIVVDNNSTDNTADIIKEYPVTYLLEKKKGWPAARNTGIRYSNAEYVANIDADCFACSDWLKNLMLSINENNVGCVVGKTLVEEGKTLMQRYYAASNPFIIEGKIGKTNYVPWGGGNNVMLREAFLKAGGYDSERFTSGADVEFHLQLEKNVGYKTKYEPKALIFHEARGTIRELFTVAAKYLHDGFLRSRTEEMNKTQELQQIFILWKPYKISHKNYYRIYIVWKLYKIFILMLAIVYRSLKALIGKEEWFRVVSSFFSIISESGMIYGYCKGRVKYMLKSSKSI